MAVEVLLMDVVSGLGIEGDVVRVADGYARNYLFPRGIATEVTEGKKRQIEKKRMELRRMVKSAQKRLDEFEAKFIKSEGNPLIHRSKGLEVGLLYGCVQKTPVSKN